MAQEIPAYNEFGWFLLPCPDCRQFHDRPEYYRSNFYQEGGEILMTSVKLECPCCRYETEAFPKTKDAVDAWNKASREAEEGNGRSYHADRRL